MQDSLGFLVDASWFLLVEANHLGEEEMHFLDRAMTGFGMPMGPLRLLEKSGWMWLVMWQGTEIPSPRLAPSSLLKEMNRGISAENRQWVLYSKTSGKTHPNPNFPDFRQAV